MNAWVAGALLLILLWALVLLAFARPLRARWREPVFRHPLLVIESDDWGAGPLAQTEALEQIASLLKSFHDRTGRAAVATLGIVFEVPDGERMAREGLVTYCAHRLDEALFAPLRNVIQSGVASGIFVPQLHGQAHYWPAALMEAAKTNADVRAWLTSSPAAPTEDLPPSLQTRWIDGSKLPSRPLDPAQIASAVADEAAGFRRVFGVSPLVSVPNTFVWNADVERAWKGVGIEVVITPGRRAMARDAAGQIADVDRQILTGDCSDAGQCYLVRDVYFEPALGHTAQRLVAGLVERTRQGRPCLVEMHRFNFLRQPGQSLDALRSAIASSLDAQPELRFVTPIELARAIRRDDLALVENRFGKRVLACLARLPEVPRFRRVALLTGLAVPLTLLERVL